MYFNGEKIPIKGFQDYVNLFLGDKDPSQRIYEKARPRAAASRCAAAARKPALPAPASGPACVCCVRRGSTCVRDG